MNINNKVVGIFAVLMMCIVSIPTSFASNVTKKYNPSTALADYVNKLDESYGYELRFEGREDDVSYACYTLISQTWKDVVWKHQFCIFTPDEIISGKHTLLFIAGSSWKDDYDEEEPTEYEEKKFRERSSLYTVIARKTKVLLIVVHQVPHQPIFDGKKEDELVAHSWDQFLKTGDPEWIVLLPMVKSAVRAMDAFEEIMGKEFSFIVMGASKRGWTTWLVGAVDQRVVAIAPIVIDILNMEQQIAHQKKMLGEFSKSINAYIELNLPERLKTKEGKDLIRIIDPYEYRKNLDRLVKMMFFGTNDEFWTVDSLNWYWGDLSGPTYNVYFPNQDHEARKKFGRIVSGVTALLNHVVKGTPLPDVKWESDEINSNARLSILSRNMKPHKIRIWEALSSTRDFHQATWKPISLCGQRLGQIRLKRNRLPLCQKGEEYIYTRKIPENKCVAFMAEIMYKTSWRSSYAVNTTIRVVGPSEKCFSTSELGQNINSHKN